MKKLSLLILLLQASLWCSSQISLSTFATGLDYPLDVKNCGDNRLFVVEQSGKIKILDTTGTYVGDFLDLTTKINFGGEQGLLGLAFDPHYSSNGFFYVNYTAFLTGETHISRFKVSANPNVADTTEKVILTIYQPFANHNGGDANFGPDGYLYIGMGDGGAGGDPDNRAQNLDSLLGKMLRIDVSDTSVDYTNPPSNPFVGTAGRDEIWDYGLRNPWRWSFDRWNNDFWIGDVGQNAYEEIDYEPAGSHGGLNYGWRCYEANHYYDTTLCNMTDTFIFPVLEIPHPDAWAITGGYVYRGAEYANLWSKYFFSDYNTLGYGVHSITHLGNNFYDSLALSHGGEFVSFGEDKYGELYIADLTGTIYKIHGDNCAPVSMIHYADSVLPCDSTPLQLYTPAGRSFHYQWFFNGTPVGTDSAGFAATSVGDYTVTTTDRNGCSATSTVVHVSACLDIEENESALSISLFPNPNNGTFTLHLAARNEMPLKIEISDMLGKIVSERMLSVKKGTNSIELYNRLASGVYTVKLYNDKTSAVRSFVVN
jgi:glucose/arabinose dehydrogenase